MTQFKKEINQSDFERYMAAINKLTGRNALYCNSKATALLDGTMTKDQAVRLLSEILEAA